MPGYNIASVNERIVGIRAPEGIVIYPIHSPALVDYNDRPELWLDVRWDLEDAPNLLYSTQIVVTLLNEPGAPTDQALVDMYRQIIAAVLEERMKAWGGGE